MARVYSRPARRAACNCSRSTCHLGLAFGFAGLAAAAGTLPGRGGIVGGGQSGWVEQYCPSCHALLAQHHKLEGEK